MRALWLGVTLIVSVLAIGSCSSTVVETPSNLAIAAGNNQAATAGTTLTTPPAVIVRDANNQPVPNVDITFNVASGGGSATGVNTTTDATGIATLGSWTLGETPGENTLTASGSGLSGSPVTFTATGQLEVPVITGPSGGAGATSSAISVPENQTSIFTLLASTLVTWSKVDGLDAALFNLDTATGELTFSAAPNFENPKDADGDNTYTLTVRATNANGNTSDQTINVTVTDVDEFDITTTVYAVSFTNGQLISFDLDDPAGTKTTISPAGSILQPAALAVGPDGNVYVGENGDGSTFQPRISKVDPSTTTLSTVYAFGDFGVFPGGLAFKGSDLLIGRNPDFIDTGPIVKLVNAAVGGPLAVSDYTSGGNLSSSPGLALAADGRLYVSDQAYDFNTSIASGPVKRFNADGTYSSEVIADGANLSGPYGVAINDNMLYTSSLMTGTVLKTDLTTDETTIFFDSGTPSGVGPLTALSDGGLLVGSPSGNGNIYHLAEDGTLLATFGSGLGNVSGLTHVETIVPQVSSSQTPSAVVDDAP